MIITISGKAGSGKTTVGRKLAERLNYDFLSVGEIRRRIAESLNLSINEFNELSKVRKEYDTMVDDYQKKLQGNIVLDSRLGFFFHPESVKLFVDVDFDVAVNRIYNDKRSTEQYFSIDDAKKYIQMRDYEDRDRLKSLYGVDFLDLKNYDLVLNSSNKTPEQLVDEIVNFLKTRNFL
ncbi:MAG: cytidylate kinase family protein [Candidatus Woesearchaeota archaeon]